jgi:hypothetical protein
MRAALLILPIVASLAACATSQPVKTAGDQNGGAASAPSRDAVRGKIPVVLKEAQASPYERPDPLTCAKLGVELGRLNDALGPDIDEKKGQNAHSDKGLQHAANADAVAIKDGAEGLIPVGGWVRFLTGAQRRDEAVKAAVTAGVERRAYLKGLAQSLGCPDIGPRPTHLFPAPPATPSTVANVPAAPKP